MNLRALFLFLLFSPYAGAQDFPTFNSLSLTRQLYNPAYTGANEDGQITFLHRQQWLGVSGAPMSDLVCGDVYLFEKQLGLGGYLLNDRSGSANQTDLFATVAYHMKTGDEHKLAFGARMGTTAYTAGLNKLQVWDPNDPVFSGPIGLSFIPKIGFGLYWHHTDWYAGISLPDMVVIDISDAFLDAVSGNSYLKRNYFAHAGGSLYLSNSWIAKPAALVKYYSGNGLTADMQCGFQFQEKFLLGAGIRSNISLYAFGKLALKQSFWLHYSFEWHPLPMKYPSYGSHELGLNYNQLN